MARTRVIQISALNIAMQSPHSIGAYVELMRQVYRRRRIVSLGKLHGAMIGSMHLIDKEKPNRGLTGEFYRFIKLDPTHPWFNLETNRAATDDDVDQIKIPKKLLPHLQRLPFYFIPKTHRLYFVSKDKSDTLSPAIAKRVIEALVQPLVELGQFPNVDVTAIPDSESLDRIFRLPQLETITIRLVRPNPDDGDEAEIDWMKRLEELNTREVTFQAKANPNESITPDEGMKVMAGVAAENGRVDAVGRDASGMRVEESTAQRPLRHREIVDSDMETTANVLARVAQELDDA